MNKLFIHNPFFRLLIPPFYGVVVYLLILLINNNIEQISDIFTGQELYVCIGLTFLLSEGLRIKINLLNHFYHSSINQQRIWVQTTLGLVISLIIISVAISTYFKLILDFSISQTQLIIFNSIFAVSSLLYNLLFFSNQFLHLQNQSRLENEEILNENIEANLVRFKNEINPNLLYNALETLITLIYKKIEEAEDYIDRLSTIYRYILGNRKAELSTYTEELKAATNIVYLLNYKYDNCIHLENHVADRKMGTSMVPGVLPALIELIIRNTIINTVKPLYIEINWEQDDGYLVIQHQLNDKLIFESDSKLLLESMQNTYGYYSEKPVVQVKAYAINYIKIPILELLEEPAIPR